MSSVAVSLRGRANNWYTDNTPKTSMRIVGMAHSERWAARFVRETAAGPRAADVNAVNISSDDPKRCVPSFARQSVADSGSGTRGIRT